jgi:Glycosyl hydrolases family 2, sugar binding domain/Glycosyl hydrolases family 2/Glycosyl hydrolases family 2, TIM barrel domain
VKFSLTFASIFPLFLGLSSTAQSNWQMQPVAIQSRWARDVNPSNALPAYPRPQMVRSAWINLNGLWDYAITSKDAATPVQYAGSILVPYPLESALSGVKKSLQPTENLWYHRRFARPVTRGGERILLHFGAVDWQTTVYINGVEIGRHSGGYTAFSFDVTDRLHAGDNNLVIRVYDPSDQGIGPHGKQLLNPQNIYYTASSGIWQTVWLETVPADYIRDIRLTPDIDHQVLHAVVDAPVGYTAELTASAAGVPVGVIKSAIGGVIDLPIPSPHLWHPGDPFLYDLTIRLLKGKRVVDEVKSYFGMRKISIAKDAQGIERICLNNQPYYNLGTLDQGFWPDGLYTAPTDEALSFDIRAIKAMGFNTIRKHIKVEPDRWYYYADSIGMLVWQDMVNPNQGLPEGAKPEFEKESAEILHQLYNHPAITTWVLFNERWGQYDQQRLTRWIKQTDPSRIVNGHTGELLYVNEQLRAPADNPYVDADMTDVHSYPDPMMPLLLPGKAQVLGEFGGIGVFIADHQWDNSSAWGYIQEKPASLAAKYQIMNEHLQLLQRQGLSGSIYTQPFDVEGEQNGLMTYDRAVVKIPFSVLRKIHSRLNTDMGTLASVTALDADLTDPGLVYARLLQEYIDGRHDPDFLKRLAMTATQVGDKPGGRLAGGEYVASLKTPLTDEQMHFVIQFTSSSGDPGFRLMVLDSADFRRVMGDRKYAMTLMNAIYMGDIQPGIEGQDDPDWNAIGSRVRTYGSPGEEIFLRAEAIYYLNKQDWVHFVPAAKEYLAKYGATLKDSERQMFEGNIRQHG